MLFSQLSVNNETDDCNRSFVNRIYIDNRRLLKEYPSSIATIPSVEILRYIL